MNVVVVSAVLKEEPEGAALLKTPCRTTASGPGAVESVQGLDGRVAVEADSCKVTGQLPRLVTTMELVETVDNATVGSMAPRWIRPVDCEIWKLSRES